MLTAEVIRLELIKIFESNLFLARVELWNMDKLTVHHVFMLENDHFVELKLDVDCLRIKTVEDIEALACSVIERMNDKMEELRKNPPQLLYKEFGQIEHYSDDRKFRGRYERWK